MQQNKYNCLTSYTHPSSLPGRCIKCEKTQTMPFGRIHTISDTLHTLLLYTAGFFSRRNNIHTMPDSSINTKFLTLYTHLLLCTAHFFPRRKWQRRGVCRVSENGMYITAWHRTCILFDTQHTPPPVYRALVSPPQTAAQGCVQGIRRWYVFYCMASYMFYFGHSTHTSSCSR